MKSLSESMKRLLLLVILFSSGLVMADAPVIDNKAKASKAFKNGQYREAVVHFQRILRDEPANAYYRIKLAKSYELRGQLDQAEIQTERVLSTDSNNTSALKLMGTIRARQGDWPASKLYFENAIKIHSNDEDAYAGLSAALIGLGDYEGAEQATGEYQRVVNNKKRSKKRNKK